MTLSRARSAAPNYRRPRSSVWSVVKASRQQPMKPMHRNAQAANEYFRIPPGRVVELGGQIEI